MVSIGPDPVVTRAHCSQLVSVRIFKIKPLRIWSHSLSFHMARKKIWTVEGFLAASMCTTVGGFRIVVQFMASAVLGASEDLIAHWVSKMRRCER